METVLVRILEARDLLAADSNGFSDPYVTMTLLDSKGQALAAGGAFKTKVVKKTLSPIWDESFLIGDKLDLRLATTLRLLISDSDGFFGSDDPIGVVDIPITLFAGKCATPLDNWYQVTKHEKMKKDARGELRVVFESVSASAPPPSVASAPSSSSLFSAGSSMSLSTDQQPNLLYVTLISGKDLLAMDGGKTSDPLVKFVLNGQKHESSMKEKTLRPQWNERFGFFATELNSSLSLVVEDFDTTINDFMGMATIDVSKLKPHQEKTMTVELLDKKGRKDKKERGTITLSMIWTYAPDAQQVAAKKKDTSVFGRVKQALNVGGPDADYDSDADDGIEVDFSKKENEGKSADEIKVEEEEREKKRQETLAELSSFEIKSGDYVVQVHIIEARDLVPKDSTGTSDPVVYVEALGEQQQTAVKKQVLNCVWDDLLIFNLRNLDKAEVEMGFVKLSVMDANTLQRAELIGTARFDISYIYSQKNHQLANVWIGLIDDSNTLNQGIQGYLRASVTVCGPGDKLIPPPSPFGPGASDDMEGNVLMPSSVAQSVRFVALTIHKAEELIPMDYAVVGKSGLDAYIMASLSGGDPIRSRVRSKKGARHELCPSFNEELMLVMREPSMADKISIGVYDWDRVGKDEVVGHIFQSIKMLKAMGGHVGPFWANIYGAPLSGNKLDVGDTVKKQMNNYPDMASTYRGRVLMTMRILDNENNEFDESNQKRNVKKLPRDLYPKTRLYRMRAHFVWGSEIPTFSSPKHLGQNSKMQLVLSVGMNELKSLRSKNIKGSVEWNTLVESERMLLPEDVSQIPDFFLYLCKGDGDTRKAVCYKRFTAQELLDRGFTSDVEWISMKEDPSIDALDDDTFPGNVLVRLGFGTEEDSSKNPWDASSTELVNKRTPYQVRVHIYQGRRLPAADSNGLLDPYLVVRCMTEKPKETTRKKKTRDPVYYETIYFDVNLPDLKYAPQVLLRVMDHDDFDSNDYVGLVALNLSEAHVRTSAQVASGKLATLPNPVWHSLMFQEPGDSEGEILASIELIRKAFPDEEVPPAPSIVPATRKAYLELTVLGLRSMEPFQFLPIQMPFVEFILGGKDHAAQEMITERSKRPSGSNPNYLQRIVKEVELPENAHFAPRLNIIVKDTRLGGFQTPIIGNASIEMNTKIPWSPHYKPPQSDGFTEIEFEAEEHGEETPLLEGQAADPLETDNGAGVFGALKSMGLDFDLNDPANFNDASSRHSTAVEDEDETQKKYLKHRELLDCELEQELKTTPFEKYALTIGQKQQKKSLMAMLNPFSKKAQKVTGGGGIYKVAGYFKGLIRIMEREDEKPLIDVERLLKPHPYEIRVYVLDGVGFAPMDLGLNGRPGKSDPYLKLKLGKEKVDDRKNYIDDTTDPDFYKMFQLSATLPGASLLKIDAMDFDLIGGDDLIGSTTIDLEDRLFDQRWQDMGKLYETANRLRLKPLETRVLTIPTSKAPMGSIKLWVDILTPAQAHDYPPIDISLPPPVEFELRVVVWKARNMVSFDEAEDMNDLFFRVWLEGSDYQETDIHWRSKKGKGSFNWRMKFPVTLGHKQPNTKYPYFHIQGWDKDVFTANDAIGEHMMDLGVFFQKAYKNKSALQFFEDDEETKKKKKKSTSDDDQAVRKIKEATGLWDDADPPDSKWMKLEQVEHKTQQRKYMGEVCVSMELVPMEKAKQQSVGQGRQNPNHSPYLPPPAGRLSFSLNPFKVFNDLLGPSICNRIMCCLCCVAFMVIIYFLAPFINVAIVAMK